MKIIVAGSREFSDYEYVKKMLRRHLGYDPLAARTIISGTARGADRLGERFALEHNLELIKMPAEWDKHGRSAGYIRNTEMAAIADECYVFWDGKSRGSKHMIDIALDKGIPVHILQGDK